MILVDTDILIDYLRGYDKAINFIEKNKNNICISVLSKMELMIGCQNKNAIKKNK